MRKNFPGSNATLLPRFFCLCLGPGIRLGPNNQPPFPESNWFKLIFRNFSILDCLLSVSTDIHHKSPDPSTWFSNKMLLTLEVNKWWYLLVRSDCWYVEKLNQVAPEQSLLLHPEQSSRVQELRRKDGGTEEVLTMLLQGRAVQRIIFCKEKE